MEGVAMHSQPMISLVIPVYNEERNLTRLIERIMPTMSAMKRPFEVILVDDGSHDSSLDILKGFTESPEIRVVGTVRIVAFMMYVFCSFYVDTWLCPPGRAMPPW